MVLFFSIVFAFLTNIADFYPLFLDPDRWVPVNTPPLAVGDEYHYFSALKMIAFGNHYGIPYDNVNGPFYLELIRIVPYILNLPAYYLGSMLFDCRYGILFVRFFDMLLLFFAIFYFIQTVNRSNGWKNRLGLSISSIFLIFYGFQGLQTFFIQSDLLIALHDSIAYFGYLTNDAFIYNNSTINDLGRAINSATTAPIFLFLLALRLREKTFSLTRFIVFLVVLAFTSLPLAVVFGVISVVLDLIHKEERSKIIQTVAVGAILGIAIIAVQTKIIFSTTTSAQEVVNVGAHLSFEWGYLAAPIVAFFTVLIGKKYLSQSVIAVLIIISLFEPLAMTIGGEHGSRLWLRSAIIPFLVLLTYLLLTFIYVSVQKLLLENKTATRTLMVLVAVMLTAIIGNFSWNNAVYLAEHEERFVNDSQLLSYILRDKDSSVVITNSTQIAMLTQLYDPSSTPLMGHFSLQSGGYQRHWEQTLLNFELLGIPSEAILQKIKKEAPQRHWLGKREMMKPGTKEYEEFYFDELLFMSTYATYNAKMMKDKVKNKEQQLEDSFYHLHVDTSAMGSLIENKKIIYLIDETMPLVPLIKTTDKVILFSHFKIFS